MSWKFTPSLGLHIRVNEFPEKSIPIIVFSNISLEAVSRFYLTKITTQAVCPIIPLSKIKSLFGEIVLFISFLCIVVKMEEGIRNIFSRTVCHVLIVNNYFPRKSFIILLLDYFYLERTRWYSHMSDSSNCSQFMSILIILHCYNKIHVTN